MEFLYFCDSLTEVAGHLLVVSVSAKCFQFFTIVRCIHDTEIVRIDCGIFGKLWNCCGERFLNFRTMTVTATVAAVAAKNHKTCQQKCLSNRYKWPTDLPMERTRAWNFLSGYNSSLFFDYFSYIRFGICAHCTYCLCFVCFKNQKHSFVGSFWFSFGFVFVSFDLSIFWS